MYGLFVRSCTNKWCTNVYLVSYFIHSNRLIELKKNCLFIGENSEYRAHKNYPQHSEGFYQKVYLLLASVYAITIFSSYVLCFPIMACISEWKSVQLNAKNSELWVFTHSSAFAVQNLNQYQITHTQISIHTENCSAFAVQSSHIRHEQSFKWKLIFSPSADTSSSKTLYEDFPLWCGTERTQFGHPSINIILTFLRQHLWNVIFTFSSAVFSNSLTSCQRTMFETVFSQLINYSHRLHTVFLHKQWITKPTRR